MKKIFFFLCFYTLLLLHFSVPPASAGCCVGPGCNPDNLPPFRCAPYYCDTQAGCDDKAAPAAPPAAAPTPTCDGGNGTPTALGCIPNDPKEAIPLILNWAIGLGAGLGFLMLLYGAFTLITAGSDPQKVDQGKGIITSAVSGLVFIILSLVLLKIIGISILGL